MTGPVEVAGKLRLDYEGGMFSWFKKAPPELPFTDRVWLDADARRRGLLREVASAPTLLVAPFPDDEDTLAAWLDAAAVTYRRATDGSGTWGQPAVTLVRADRLHHLRGPGPVGARPVVFGHFPHPIEDRALREVLAALLPAPPIYLSALDDPLLRQLGGDRTQELMVKLGMDPDETIEHPLVSRALSRAREKVGERVPAPRPARSTDEWIAKNLG